MTPRQIKEKGFLDKVANQLVSETDINPSGGIEFPFYDTIVNMKVTPTNITSYFIYNFSNHCRDVYGLNDDERMYVWGKYKTMFFNKLYNGNFGTTQYVNESNNIDDPKWYYQYVFNSKFLSKVLEQLLSETKIEWDTQENGISLKVAWDPYMGYQRDVSYPLFQRHCEEVYLLNPIEISDIYMLYMKEISERRGLILKDKITGVS